VWQAITKVVSFPREDFLCDMYGLHNNEWMLNNGTIMLEVMGVFDG
jgi:hypothetical protein